MKTKITVMGVDVSYKRFNDNDFVSLTDLAKFKTDAPDRVIATWMRIYNTICYLGTWEIINNPNFKPHIYEGFKTDSAENAFWLSPQKWVENTGAIGMVSKAGRYGGGTWAHKDIAFKFASWLSVEFELYLVTEFQRLKVKEYAQLEWNAKRELSKINYHLQTGAIKDHIVPNLKPSQVTFAYTDEADILNVALFGHTAKEWRTANPDLAETSNVRDHTSAPHLLVLANMESYNAEMIRQGIPSRERIQKLNDMAKYQLPAVMQSTSPLLIEDKKKTHQFN